MKGAELPMNLLVILVIAVIVLIAVVGFFLGIFGQSSSGLSLEATRNNACQKFVSIGGCSNSSIADSISVDKVDCLSEDSAADGYTLTEFATDCYSNVPPETLCSCS
ncbi:MAG: hypothetical protein PHU12_04385 [Candidatus Aenigmarchaeota archaeon]|nr:hypothetical protein [Candidatus Aenigmarchaeota archaeon]